MPFKKQREQWKNALVQAIAVFTEKGEQATAFTLADVLGAVVVKPSARPTRWMFKHVGESGKEFFTYHDETPENDYRVAYRDTCVEVTELYSAPPDPWRDAVTDACTVAGLDWNDDDPRDTLYRLVQYNIALHSNPATPPTPPPDIRTPHEAILNKPAAAPDPSTFWIHTSGRVYKVVCITNLMSTDIEKFPRMVVYQGVNGHIWSRAVHDWARSFIPTTEEPRAWPQQQA